MVPLSEKQKIDIISRIYWDQDVDAEDVLTVLSGQDKDADQQDKITLYRRILTSCDWYTILKMIPPQKLEEALSDSVLMGLFPKDLIDKYRYARSILRR